MERNEFIDALKREGYAEIASVTRDANGTVDDHVHSFEAKALILHGETDDKHRRRTADLQNGRCIPSASQCKPFGTLRARRCSVSGRP